MIKQYSYLQTYSGPVLQQQPSAATTQQTIPLPNGTQNNGEPSEMVIDVPYSSRLIGASVSDTSELINGFSLIAYICDIIRRKS